ncbi:protein BCCIP homolog [Arctopsyche grandis]|uniref:protein BCCIP homolog n=1 Tax=Arctopsyche grandis TaxID=121162 RepID=UPI00406D7395
MPRAAKQRATEPPGADSHPDMDAEDIQEIQVDFEGRTPQDSDFHGIKMLLQQLLLKAHINLSEFSNLIIGNNYIGSVIKQSDDMDEVDEEPDTSDDVFGITTLVPLDQKQTVGCVHQLRQLLTDFAEDHANDQMKKLIQRVLNSNSALLLNERLVNIPAQISAPLFESLREELHKALDRRIMTQFDYFVMICKIYKQELPKNQRANKNDNTTLLWSNSEEEVVCAEAVDFFEFSVQTESDLGFTGDWLEEDNTMMPFRRVLIIDGKKMDNIVNAIKSHVS